MVLNHLNLAVTDVARAHQFLETYFGLRGTGPVKPNSPIAFLRDDNGMVLTLTNLDGATEVRYPPTFHIGFIQESPEKVDAINERLRADGYEVEEPSRQHGSWTFYFLAPGGFTIEVLH